MQYDFTNLRADIIASMAFGGAFLFIQFCFLCYILHKFCHWLVVNDNTFLSFISLFRYWKYFNFFSTVIVKILCCKLFLLNDYPFAECEQNRFISVIIPHEISHYILSAGHLLPCIGTG